VTEDQRIEKRKNLIDGCKNESGHPEHPIISQVAI
jgi:hypothetical protein